MTTVTHAMNMNRKTVCVCYFASTWSINYSILGYSQYFFSNLQEHCVYSYEQVYDHLLFMDTLWSDMVLISSETSFGIYYPISWVDNNIL